GLAGRADPRAARARAAALRHRLAMAPAAVLLPRSVPSDAARRPAGNGALRRDADQDLEQRADRTPAAGTGEAAARGKDRSAGQPDQSALTVQHPDIDHVVDPYAARHGAHVDYEIVRTAAPADAQHRSFCDAP